MSKWRQLTKHNTLNTIKQIIIVESSFTLFHSLLQLLVLVLLLVQSRVFTVAHFLYNMSIINLLLVVLTTFSATTLAQIYGAPLDGGPSTSDGPEEITDLIGDGNFDPAFGRLTENFGGLDSTPAVSNLFDTFSGFDFFGNRKGMFESTNNDDLPDLSDILN
eukprot:TRINITY_DN4763_c0_g4_i2.p2 TRINITY_DN4763_c0_g4~~TRINITY_DN4763_c0_g4_i2.p2  ORF type:complete len:162 (-),score=3.66 TRINITY_DN4763_c0_g4_i2:1176-1661(-)